MSQQEEAYKAVKMLESIEQIPTAYKRQLTDLLMKNADLTPRQKRTFVKRYKQANRELFKFIREDEKRRKEIANASADKVIAAIATIENYVNDMGECELDVKELAAEMGMRLNNFYCVRKYLLEIEYLMKDEAGSVPAKSLADNSALKIMENKDGI